MKRILVTGGAGFISSNMIRYLLQRTDHEVVTMDALTYAGNLDNLDDVMGHERLRFIKGDIRDVHDVTEALDGVDVIVNAAAESQARARSGGARPPSPPLPHSPARSGPPPPRRAAPAAAWPGPAQVWPL